LAVNVHWLPDKISSVVGELPFKVQVFHEERIRGTAGGVAGARAALGLEPVLVVNGDIWGAVPVDGLLEVAHRGPSSGLVLTVSGHHPRGQGTVGLDAADRVVRLRGCVVGEEVRGVDYAGVALLSPRLVVALPEEGCLIGDVAIPALERGEDVLVHEMPSDFIDVGSLPGYLEANRSWLAEVGTERLAEGLPLAGRVGGGSYLGPGTSVAPGIELCRSVVGAGAVVEGSGTLDECVIWPGARVRAPLRRAVVMGSGQVVHEMTGAGT
ncbi:MAG TPA: NDP-sugar synthase, partial [Polyangiaceae bacterium]|nr:NDP-sugar synthase [Polyangiaceae bacterium]